MSKTTPAAKPECCGNCRFARTVPIHVANARLTPFGLSCLRFPREHSEIHAARWCGEHSLRSAAEQLADDERRAGLKAGQESEIEAERDFRSQIARVDTI